MATAGIMRGVMFLRHTKRKKDGKEHRYWSIVEYCRVGGGRVVQRPLLYLGEINDLQELARRESDRRPREGAAAPRPLSLFPEDRCEGVLPDAAVVRLKLAELRLCRPRQWGGCWLAVNLSRELALDRFWAERLGPSRKGTRWHQVLLLFAIYRLLAPGREWRLHRQSFEGSAMADLLGEDVGLGEDPQAHTAVTIGCSNTNKRCSTIWSGVGATCSTFRSTSCYSSTNFTITYFESDPCRFRKATSVGTGIRVTTAATACKLIIALVVTPEGLPLAYEVLPGNTADNTTLKDFLAPHRGAIRQGAPDLADGPRRADRSGAGRDARCRSAGAVSWSARRRVRLTQLEKGLVDKPWHDARPGVQVKLLPQDGELYVFAQSTDRVAKERAIRLLASSKWFCRDGSSSWPA